MNDTERIEQMVARGWGSNLLQRRNAKTTKGESLGWVTGILHMAPSDESAEHGGTDTCPMASDGCRKACLYTAGRGRFRSIQLSRIAKTVYFVKRREEFLSDLRKSVEAVVRVAGRVGVRPAVRLNGTSDIAWESVSTILNEFPDVQFYDYTKVPVRAIRSGLPTWPRNYHLTFSRSESNQESVERVMAENPAINIAVVFRNALPETWMGRKVIAGDDHDLRFLDERGVVVGLTEKGLAKRDETGFVIG